MFDYNGHIHVYSPGAGEDSRLGTNCFHNIIFNILSICPFPASFDPQNIF